MLTGALSDELAVFQDRDYLKAWDFKEYGYDMVSLGDKLERDAGYEIRWIVFVEDSIGSFVGNKRRGVNGPERGRYGKYTDLGHTVAFCEYCRFGR